jgi:hypothetical protein
MGASNAHSSRLNGSHYGFFAVGGSISFATSSVSVSSPSRESGHIYRSTIFEPLLRLA